MLNDILQKNIKFIFKSAYRNSKTRFAGSCRINTLYSVITGKIAGSFVMLGMFCLAVPVWGAEHSSKAVGCSTTGAVNIIKLSNVPARESGVAPLSVFFDATGTNATTTNRPFHELEYRWSFGEDTAVLATLPGGVNWTNGSTKGNRNLATGPVAAHVFETPGIYTVSLTVTDGANSVTNSCTKVLVQDPETVFAHSNTICVGATSQPDQGNAGCPSGAKTVQEENFTAAIGKYAKTGKRVLFRRGDTFIAASTARVMATGPGIIGGFGVGALPVVKMTGDVCTLCFSSRSTPAFSDWRIMDLEFNGMGSFKSLGTGIDDSGGGIGQVTLLRLSFRNFGVAIGFGADLLNYWNNTSKASHNIDQLAIVDTTVLPGKNTQYGGYNAGNRVSFMGNDIDNGGIQIRQDARGRTNPNANDHGSHVTRFPYLGKAVISNNSLSRPGFDRHIIKLHAPFWINGVPDTTEKSNFSSAINGDGYTKQVLIADNKFTDYLDPWAVAIGPQNGESDERIRDVILERNLHISTSRSEVSQVIRAREVTVRNNLFLGGGSKYQVGVMLDVYGIEPPASNIWIYNNTQYSTDATVAGEFKMVDIRNPHVSNVTIKNNLAYAPNAVKPMLYANDGAANVIVSNNSTDFQIKSKSPLFVEIPSDNIANWKLRAGSYAINEGAKVPVWSDFLGNSRVKKIASDIGAMEAP